MHREVEQFEGTHVLREVSEVYGFKSAVFWNEKLRRCEDIGGPTQPRTLYFLCAAQSIGGFVSTARNAGSIITLSMV